MKNGNDANDIKTQPYEAVVGAYEKYAMRLTLEIVLSTFEFPFFRGCRELAYQIDSKLIVCGFKSHHPHQYGMVRDAVSSPPSYKRDFWVRLPDIPPLVPPLFPFFPLYPLLRKGNFLLRKVGRPKTHNNYLT